ncbi:hypothetical protein GCM10022402_07220 [Salinactinospora qingdaonensis]|uniref:Uncharacterized protein n=2 Tax=Salinactinospora qingdaonensis TaxID=702744 RepID=A0ABP7F0T0_9ACTN
MLASLDAQLRGYGLDVQLDSAIGAVDAMYRAGEQWPGPTVRRVILRPHRGQLWWWLRWPSEHACPLEHPGQSTLVPLAPASHTSEAVRRIVATLRPFRGGQANHATVPTAG